MISGMTFDLEISSTDRQMDRLISISHPQSGAPIREMKISALHFEHDFSLQIFDLHPSRNLKEP